MHFGCEQCVVLSRQVDFLAAHQIIPTKKYTTIIPAMMKSSAEATRQISSPLPILRPSPSKE
jgi:hypothetical protein